MLLLQRIHTTLANHASDCKPVLVTEKLKQTETVMKEMLDNIRAYFFFLPTLPNFVYKSD